MIILRRNNERRHLQRGQQDIWLTFQTDKPAFSVGDGFGVLTAFDEMLLPAGEMSARIQGDGAETVTYVHRGVLAQEDSIGGSCVVHSGEFQYRVFGRGISHKETNPSHTDRAHFFRISLRPAQTGLNSTNQQMRFPAGQRHNSLCVIASPYGRKKSLKILQDALVYSSILDSGYHLVHELLPGRGGWLHVISGEVALQEIILIQGDGAGVTGEPSISITAQESSEILLVDFGRMSRPVAGWIGQ